MNRIRTLLTPTIIEDEDRTRQARLLNAIVGTFFVISVIGGLALLILEEFGIRFWMAVTVLVGFGSVHGMMRRGYIQLASLVLVLVLSLATTITVFRLGGLRVPGISFFVIIALISGLLLDLRVGLVVVGLLVAAVLGLYYAELDGLVNYTVANEPLPVVLVANIIILAMATALIYLYSTQVKQALAYAKFHERTLEANNHALQQEIVERHKAEAALQDANTEIQQTQALLRALIDNVPAAIMIRGKDGRYSLANRQAAQWSGYTIEQFIGRMPDELFPLEIRGTPKPVEADSPPMQREFIWPGPDKSRICHQFRFPIFDDANNFQGICLFILDVTTQKQLAEALQDNEAYLRAIINNIPFDLWVCDAEGRYIIQNAISLDLAGDLTGKTVDDLALPAAVRAEYKQKHLQALSGNFVREEVELLIKGQLRIVDSIQVPIRDDRPTSGCGGILGFIGMQIDITERKQTELALRRRAEEMTALYETSLEMNADLELSTLLPAIVCRAATLLGVEMGNLLLVRPDLETLETVAVYNRSASEVGISISMGQGVAGRVAKSGEPLLISDYRHWSERTPHFANEQIGRVLGAPLKQGQQVLGVLNVFDPQPGDFSEDNVQLLSLFAAYAAIIIQHARLFEAEQHHREIAETLSEIARVTNLSLNLDEVLRHVIEGLEKIIPYQSLVIFLIEGEFFRCVASTEQENVTSKAGPVYPIGKLRFNKFVVQTRRPQLVPDTQQTEHFSPVTKESAQVRCVIGIPLISQDNVIGVMSIGNYTPHSYGQDDVLVAFRFAEEVAMAINNATLFRQIQEVNLELEQKVAERTQALEAAQERLIRQEKLAFLGQLSGGVGHELRNPLGVISNAIYYLQMVLAEADESVKEYLNLITDRVQEADKIVSDLLNLSRNRTADKAEVSVQQLVEEVLSRDPAPSGVIVTIDLASGLPTLLIDQQQVRQVLTNLVINAYQAMPKGGTLTISAQLVQRRETSDLELSITDTGTGMSPETLEKIFEPLYTTKNKGIGLGLAVSKNLTELNGGRIIVKSVEGQGSTFTLSLPVGTSHNL